MQPTTNNRLIHIARMQPKGIHVVYLFLRQLDPHHFRWFEEKGNEEIETAVFGNSIEEAIRQSHRHWKNVAFRTVNCGFRFTLPERDEHGSNALFYQMVSSYSSMNGFYFDEELGFNCIVHQASLEARQLWNRLRQTGKQFL